MARAKETLPDMPKSLEEFDAWHAERPERWEFIFGEPVMMAPASMAHTIIKSNIVGELGVRLRGTGCRAYVSGLEVKAENFSAMPDVLVDCDPIDRTSSTVANPKAIVEVLSPSTASLDRHEKWRAYCLIEGLAHHLTVAQKERLVTLHTRTGPFTWDERVILEGDVRLDAIGVVLPLAEIYDGVTFEGEANG